MITVLLTANREYTVQKVKGWKCDIVTLSIILSVRALLKHPTWLLYLMVSVFSSLLEKKKNKMDVYIQVPFRFFKLQWPPAMVWVTIIHCFNKHTKTHQNKTKKPDPKFSLCLATSIWEKLTKARSTYSTTDIYGNQSVWVSTQDTSIMCIFFFFRQKLSKERLIYVTLLISVSKNATICTLVRLLLSLLYVLQPSCKYLQKHFQG